MSSEQLLVLLLLAAAFAAGWIARGGRVEDEEEDGAAPATGPATGGARAASGDGSLLTEADTTLGRALTAAKAARAVTMAPAGVSETATRAALGVLDMRLAELEDVADRLETARGPADQAFLAFDRCVSGMATLRRRVDGEGALAEVEAARSGWELAIR